MRHFSRRLISQSLSWHSKSTPITHNPAIRVKYPEAHFKSAKFTTAALPAPTEKVSLLVDELSELTLMDIMELNDVLRDKFGIQSMPAMAVMMPGMKIGAPGGAQGGSGAAKVEEKAEKTAFDLKLEGGFDAGVKLKIIKEVRAFTALGLKEAKELVEKAPTLLKKGVTKEEAEKIVEKMKEVGAKVTME